MVQLGRHLHIVRARRVLRLGTGERCTSYWISQPLVCAGYGYGGNGMTFGFLAARLLLERLQGVQSQDHALFAFDRLR